MDNSGGCWLHVAKAAALDCLVGSLTLFFVYFALRDRRRLVNPGTSEGSISPTCCQPFSRSHVRGAATSHARSTSA